MTAFSTIAAIAAFAASASAHGIVKQVTSAGTTYPGGLTDWFWQKPIEPTAGWHALNQDTGFVDPPMYASADVICHKSATPGELSVKVAAGSSLSLQWSTWPDGHKGPILNYLAACNGDCKTVDKAKLSWAKIQEEGVLNAANNYWATDKMTENGSTYVVNIPASVAPGNYVLRHEIIALHSAYDVNAAQNYPSCINLEVTGSGKSVPSGYAATDLYKASDAGIHFNIYQPFTSYPIPGPEMWDGAC